MGLAVCTALEGESPSGVLERTGTSEFSAALRRGQAWLPKVPGLDWFSRKTSPIYLPNLPALVPCLFSQKKYDQAEALCRLTIEIEEATQTPCRPRIAMRLAKLANIFTSQVRNENQYFNRPMLSVC